ncbi:MAG: HAD family phosphatase [Verrucomicrobia bacterium]|nr:HAD family phosphatase [Verrucomicrobiota bacterium]
MKRFEAVIFDMDGVIVDSEPIHEQAFREIFHAIGYGENHGIDFAAYYGKSDRTLWLDFIEKHRPTQTLDELADWKLRRFIDIIRRDEPIYESLPALVEDLALDHKLAVASGSSHPVIDEILAMQNLRRFFPVVVSAQDVVQGKPAPDIFLRAADLMRVSPRSCCVIEDSAAGVDGALAAGMQVIAITNSLTARQLSRATHVVGSYQEIRRLLLA